MFDFWDLQLQILVLTLLQGKLSSRTSCVDFAPTNWPASASAELFCGPLTSVALLLLLFLNIFLVADGFGLVTPAQLTMGVRASSGCELLGKRRA